MERSLSSALRQVDADSCGFGPSIRWPTRPCRKPKARPIHFGRPTAHTIAFFVAGKLKKVALAGGPSQTICDAPEGRGGTWNSDGVIVFSPGLGSAIERVSAAGGVPTAVTKLGAKEELQRYPMFLPDNKHFLYVVNAGKPETNGINIGSVDGAPPVHLLSDDSSASYVPSKAFGGSGLLLFRRENTLMGVPFDLQPASDHGRSISRRGGGRHRRKYQLCSLFGFEQRSARLRQWRAWRQR